MYETEINFISEAAGQIPLAVLADFSTTREFVDQRTMLPWGEHCTECAWPSCYHTCEFYTPRADLHCRRFLDGIIRIPVTDAVPAYLIKMTFNKWAKLEAAAPGGLLTQSAARRAELRDLQISSAFSALPMPYEVRRRLMGRRKSWKEAYSRKGNDASRSTSFMLECFNPQAEEIEITLVMRPKNDAGAIPYERRIVLPPGYNCLRMPIGEITARLDLTSPFLVQLIPSPQAAGLTVIFGLLDFVQELKEGAAQEEEPAKPAKQVKCVVWDLDNTLWRGIMIEDGADALVANDAVMATVKELDRRGILNSIASKNDRDEAVIALERFGIREYFLYPQISWSPKSAGIEAIAASLNIGIDSLAFVDDQAFERAEVASRHPSVRTYDVRVLDTLLTRPEFDAPVTEESHRRRSFYIEEEKRATQATSYDGDYLEFLRSCHLRIALQPLTDAVLDRVHELTQRTNQMNFSGNRYDKETLKRIMGSRNHETFVISCADRFGDYGTVGFAVLEKHPKLMMTDLMFSCRVQSKHVEHAFMTYLLSRCKANYPGVFVRYRMTPRNVSSGRVFKDFGFDMIDEAEDVRVLYFDLTKEIVNDRVADVVADHA